MPLRRVLALTVGSLCVALCGAVKPLAMTGGAGGNVAEAALPPRAEGDYLAAFLRANYWRRSAASSASWRLRYDGPTHEQCEKIGVRYYAAEADPLCGAPCDDWLGVEARRTCVGGECAAHVTLVTDERFAALATARVACFVAQRLGDEPGAVCG